MARKTILVVDDEQDFREVIADLLKEAGYTVLMASDLNAALAEISGCVPDLVISDIEMPGGSGLVLLETLRKAAPNLPIILMSGGLRVSAQEAAERGAIGFLEKPVQQDALIFLLQAAGVA